MKKIRLKEDCKYSKMSTPYGVIAHNWVDVKDDAYVYKEMEVLGEAKPDPKPVVTVEEELVVEEPVVEEEVVVEYKPPFKKKVKKRK